MAKAKLGTGTRFKNLEEDIASGYEKKGMSAKRAEAIGAKTAAKIGRAKYGNKRFSDLSKGGKK